MQAPGIPAGAKELNMGLYYDVALDLVVLVGIGAFLWSVARSFRLIAETFVKRGRAATASR